MSAELMRSYLDMLNEQELNHRLTEMMIDPLDEDERQGVAEGPIIPVKPPPRGDFRERFNNRFARQFARSIAPRVFADHRRLNAYSQIQRYGFAIAREELGSQQRLNDLITDTEFVTYLEDAYVAIQKKAENQLGK